MPTTSNTSASGRKAPSGYQYETSGKKSKLVRIPRESGNAKVGFTSIGKKRGETKQQTTERFLKKVPTYIAGKGRVLPSKKAVQSGKLKGQFVKTLGSIGKDDPRSQTEVADQALASPEQFQPDASGRTGTFDEGQQQELFQRDETDAQVSGAVTTPDTTAVHFTADDRPIEGESDTAVVNRFQGADAETLLEGIRSGQITANSSDPNWRALYEFNPVTDKYQATTAMIDAHNRFQDETGQGDKKVSYEKILTGQTDVGAGEEVASSVSTGSQYDQPETSADIIGALTSGLITPEIATQQLSDLMSTTIEVAKGQISNMNIAIEMAKDFTGSNYIQNFGRTEEVFHNAAGIVQQAQTDLNTVKIATQEAIAQSRDAELDTAELTANRQRQLMEQEYKQGKTDLNAAMIRQSRHNQEQNIRNQTFRGLSNGFGDSAAKQIVDKSAQSGLDALNSMNKDLMNLSERYTQNMEYAESKYLQDINNINSQKNLDLVNSQAEFQAIATTISLKLAGDEIAEAEALNDLTDAYTKYETDLALAQVETTNRITSGLMQSMTGIAMADLQQKNADREFALKASNAGKKVQAVKEAKSLIDRIIQEERDAGGGSQEIAAKLSQMGVMGKDGSINSDIATYVVDKLNQTKLRDEVDVEAPGPTRPRGGTTLSGQFIEGKYRGILTKKAEAIEREISKKRIGDFERDITTTGVIGGGRDYKVDLYAQQYRALTEGEDKLLPEEAILKIPEQYRDAVISSFQ